MLSLTGPQIAALNAGSIKSHDLMLFELDSGNYGFHAGTGPLVWNSITFKGSGTLIQIEPGAQGIGMESNGLTLRLYANPDVGLSPNVLTTIFVENVRRRKFTAYEALFDTTTYAMIGNPLVRYRGYIHSIEMKEDGGDVYLEGKIESRSLDYTKRGYAMANNSHHQLVSPGDRFFDSSATAGRVALFFGSPVAPNSTDTRPVQ